MFDILFARTFCIVGGMLLITALFAYLSKNSKGGNFSVMLIIIFVVLFMIMFFGNIFPLNLILVGIFSALLGWVTGPAVKGAGDKYKIKLFLKERGIVLAKGETLNEQQITDFIEYSKENGGESEWNRVLSMAFLSTAIAVFATALLVFTSSIDFSFMGMFLFIALTILVIMGLLNLFFFRSELISLIKAYFGVVIFTLYLVYDFNTLEKMAGDDSWGTAIDISVNLYLDIMNLFLDILQILSDHT
ncbi:MAG: Bax inhibitor-1 family protein [Candidatus Gracilibacteria bacterium]|nr:Bax inhibitor-1 family protein [Candidatus Gracilibacteria bacterium]